MLEFRVDMPIEKPDSELYLNDNWRIVFSRIRQRPFSYINIRIENCSKLPSEEFSISGNLSVVNCRGIGIRNKKFSVSMKESKCILLFNSHVLNFVSCDEAKPKLYGSITIRSKSNSKECASALENGENVNCSTTQTYQPNSMMQLSNDLERLLDPQTSSFVDVNLKCGSDSIPAHKIILSTRSPVFAAMFKHPMKETQTNKVNITDIDAPALRAMLFYIYTGRVASLSVKSASDLLFAADKYGLQELKDICCDFLKKNVTLQNVLEILVLGDTHAENLKSFAMEYILKECANFSEFEASEEWKALRKERPTLAVDVLSFLVKSRDKK